MANPSPGYSIQLRVEGDTIAAGIEGLEGEVVA